MMSGSNDRVLLWGARLSGTATVVLLMMLMASQEGGRPSGMREWVFLALFPFGFSAGLLVGWRWPLFGGVLSLLCMVASWVVIGPVFPLFYLAFGCFSVPGVLYVIAGLRLRSVAKARAAGTS